MSDTTDSGFDFDTWARLAREDPEEFEQRRQAAIQTVIDARPDLRPRLEGLQFRLDAERRLARTPLKSCLRMSQMMWDSFYSLKGQLDEFTASVRGEQSLTPAPQASAEIIPLHRSDQTNSNNK